MKQQIREVTLSLQHLSAVVLPELKRVSSVILASASDAGLTQAGTLQTLLLDAHRIADAALKGLAQVVKEDRTTDDSGVVQTRKVCELALKRVHRLVKARPVKTR